MTLMIVIVNYKTPKLTVDALVSLEPEIAALNAGDEVLEGMAVRVVVVENGSGDDSVHILRQAIAQHGWTWCELLVQEKNLGFSGGNNVALRPALALPRSIAGGGEAGARPDYFVLLNPDTLVRPGGMRELVKFMQGHPEVGIAGSRLEDPDGTPQRSAFKFPHPWTELNDTLRIAFLEKSVPRSVMAPPVRSEAHLTDWVAGASMIIRPEVFEDIGLLDEGYFVYFEEVDFCLRASRVKRNGKHGVRGGGGWECGYVPASRVVHLIGMASQVNNPSMVPKRRPRYWFDARKRFYRKNYGLVTSLLADLAWMSGYLVFRVRRWVQRRPTNDPPRFFRDFVRYTYFSGPAK